MPPATPAWSSPAVGRGRRTRSACSRRWRRSGATPATAAAIRFPSSPAPRRAPSTPRRWPVAPTTSTPPWPGLCQVWENFSADQVYRADSLGVIRTGARWLTMMSLGWVIARWRRARPRSLLDNPPLEALLNRLVSTERLHRMMREGHLHALAVTASSYGSGLHVTFYDALDRDRAVDALAAPGGARRHHRAAPARLLGDPVRLSGGGARDRRPHRVLRRRLDAPGRADLAGRAPGRRAHPRRRCRTHARAARRARRQQRVPEPGADRRACAVEHLPRRARGRRRAPAPHQRDARRC